MEEQKRVKLEDLEEGKLKKGAEREKGMAEVVIEIEGGAEAVIEGARAVARVGIDTEGGEAGQDQEDMEVTGDIAVVGAVVTGGGQDLDQVQRK